MADNLIFPIGFDLQKAVDDAGKEWDNKYAGLLEKQMAKRPVRLKLELEKLDDVKRRLAEIKLEPVTAETKSSIRELARELQTLAKALEAVQKYSSARAVASPDAVRAARIAEIEAKRQLALAKARAAAEKTRQAEERLALARERAARAAQRSADGIRTVNEAYKAQEGYISRLLKRMAVYAGYSMATGFLTNVREVTAQFELQRISLGAIIQDQQKANQIFAEIKSFALTSPLKILDLTKYTKQVAAYGFETEKLFGTTKMLADISVGLGVDMSRLTLFLGQVFATGYLRASEVRQATEAGIPLVDKLAKKLEELNGRAYTAAEVMDMISKRAISYELVEQVFKDMTSAGGEFYNMQVKQSQTLFGMWSKLGDAAAIMYDQIGNTSSINAGMKLTIRSIEQMMRNWKTTARVLDSVAVATTVYVLALKNAAIASKAVTTTEAARLAITNSQVIATPKLVASIIGQNAATKLSTTLTRAHTVSMLNQSAATNVLTRGFWKLTAAMLANPWVAAAAAIAGVAAAIIHFTGNAETAAERAEKLNNSVSSLKNLEDTTGPLIDTYNELINKTERTTEEQKKLSAVTHELAKQYPGAITAIGNFGEEVELASDKLNQLYQAEKQARMNNTRDELEQTEAKIKETESAIDKLQSKLASGGNLRQKLQYVPGAGYVESGETEFVPFSPAERKRILREIDILREGENGSGGLVGLRQSAEAARRALDLIPSEAAQAVEKFGAWKKTFTTFRQQVGDVRVQLFDDSTIDQFGSLEEALKKTAEEYKKNITLVATYDDVLQSTTLTAEERAKIETERAEADTMAALAKNALTYYNALSLLEEKSKGSGRTSDPRLSILQEMVSTLKQVNKEYDDLAKKEGAAKALADTDKVYADTFKNMQQLATKYKFELPELGVPTDAASLTKYLNAIREAMKKLPKSDKAVLALQVDIDKLNIDEQQKRIESELKRLSDRISRTKTAKEFYERILGQTGDLELAANLSLRIYGEHGEDLDKAIRDNIQATLGKNKQGIDLDFSAAIRADGSVDYNALAKIAKGYLDLDDISEDTYNKILKMRDEDRNSLAKTVEGWLKATEKAKTYSDKLLDLRRKTQTEIDKINKTEANKDISSEYAESQRAEFLRKEAEEVAKLQYEAFKDSPMYVQMFDDLDNASTGMLNSMKSRLEGLQAEWKNLDPTQLKEMQSRLNEIDQQLARRNPFSTLVKAIKDYQKLRKGGDDGLGPKSEGEAEKALDAAAKARLEAEKQYLEILHKEGATQEEIAAAKQKFDDAQSREDAAAKALEAWKKVKDAIGLSTDEIFGMMNMIGDAARSIANLTEAFGGDKEDVQYWNDVADAMGEITSGVQNLAKSILSIDIPGIISSVVTAVPNMIAGFSNLFSAGKVRKANKEIEKQQKLLDRLEYTYSRLERAAEDAFGSEFIANIRQQRKALEAEMAAYEKQAQAERSKGKKKDKERIKEYEDAARDVRDQILELQGTVAERMLGTDMTSAARDFASAWLDAYKEFGNTTEAVRKKFKEMIDNMVVEGVISRVMQNALQPMFNMIDEAQTQDFYSPDFWKRVTAQMQASSTAADRGARIAMSYLERASINIRELGDDLTGTSRDIARASEESVTGLAQGVQTQNYYMSFMPAISDSVSAIRRIMEQQSGASTATPAGGVDLMAIQEEGVNHLRMIERHTADTVAECRRIAIACEEEVSQLRRVIVPQSASGASGYGVRVWAR